MRYPRILCSILLLSFATTVPAAEPAVPWAPIELAVRGPDAKPLANAKLLLKLLVRDVPRDGEAVPEQEVTTDTAGIARLRWPQGVSRMSVDAPGVGYGFTGFVEVTAKEVARPPLPPLAPYAVLEGTVPAEWRGDDFELNVRRFYDDNGTSVPISPTGTFRATVPSGIYSIFVTQGKTRVAALPNGIRVEPGQTVAGLTPGPIVPEPKGTVIDDNLVSVDDDKRVPWLAGVIRDEKGTPISGAKVWAYGVYHGGMRSAAVMEHARSNAAGGYQIIGDGGLNSLEAALVAHVPGRPPVWAWFEGPQPRWLKKGTPVPPLKQKIVDLIIPSAGGTMEVQVSRDGKPASGASVGAWIETASRPEGTFRAQGDEVKSLEAAIHPVVTTDANGVARFTALIPGTYTLFATTGNEQNLRSGVETWRRYEQSPFGTSIAIPVRVGETTRHRLVLSPTTLWRTLTLHRPDGSPLQEENPEFSYGPAAQALTRSGSTHTTDMKGTVSFGFDKPGLWNAQYRFRSNPHRQTPFYEAPFFEAERVLASSPNLPAMPALPLTARPRIPGSIRVELKDADGSPLAGVVSIGEGLEDVHMIGSTDSDGVVVFRGLQPWKRIVRAHSPKWPAIHFDFGTTLPDDATLHGRSMLLPQTTQVELDTEQRLTLRVEPVGFVAASVDPLVGPPTWRTIMRWSTVDTMEISSRYDYDSGQFLAGPLRNETVELKVHENNEQGNMRELLAEKVPVRVSEVTRIALKPSAEALKPPAGFGERGFEKTRRTFGTVLLADGKSPALGAVVQRLESGWRKPVELSLSDASGVIRARNAEHFGLQAVSTGPNDPPGEVLVATLPGSHGAAVIPVPPAGTPARLVLPPPISVKGKITIGAAAQGDRPGSVRVFASYEGPGHERIGELLSVQTTASADGTFELAGLTPGRYRVQAALDEIWVSPTVEIDVPGTAITATTAPATQPGGALITKQLPPINLAIAEPGSAVRIRVVDATGKPAIHRAITIDLPAGPLTESLWPRSFKTDGAGVAVIPTLGVGRYAARIDGTETMTPFEVKSLATETLTELAIKLPLP